jgi:small subunit ribosomal protein S20
MANIKSAIKNIRKSAKNHVRNHSYKDKIKKLTKAFKVALVKNKEEAAKVFKDLSSALDKAALKKIIHKNKAARLKSRLQKSLKAK